MNLVIDKLPLMLGQLRQAWQHPVRVTLGDDARQAIAASSEVVQEVVRNGKQVYGVNTGFGQLAQVRISDDELTHLQENLVRSHAVGVGELLPDAVVRLVMIIKVAALAQGYSGVRPELVDGLCELINHNIHPAIPAKGSVGASGDLAPLAHMGGALLGYGNVRVNGEMQNAQEALSDAGLAPLTLAPKEGLALLNGTQVSTALALAAVFRAEHLLAASLTSGALAADAIKGSDTPFDERIQTVRRHRGQAAVAKVLRELMQGSEIRASHC